MRALFIFPIAVTAPVVMVLALQSVTGDPLSAVLLELLLLITFAAWFSHPVRKARPMSPQRFG